ncbi:probable G-protein coupled receptor 132 [Lates japonicus]|uniref:Probable G-protein coupled receptor 132 n=1 Tax=Lates japonicus TaxID=270547 RepID=A0AAD3RK23_LATJO|nr:probable G-protein coupled receptor 132 [Lates japonicus]
MHAQLSPLTPATWRPTGVQYVATIRPCRLPLVLLYSTVLVVGCRAPADCLLLTCRRRKQTCWALPVELKKRPLYLFTLALWASKASLGHQAMELGLPVLTGYIFFNKYVHQHLSVCCILGDRHAGCGLQRNPGLRAAATSSPRHRPLVAARSHPLPLP